MPCPGQVSASQAGDVMKREQDPVDECAGHRLGIVKEAA